MKTITKYQSDDGSEWNSREDAIRREALCERINESMILVDFPIWAKVLVAENKGYWQHDLKLVHAAREAILSLARPIYGKSYPEAFNVTGSEAHPLSVIGRILSEGDRPLSLAWNRFARIDEVGREFSQCYYAYGAGVGEIVNCLNQ